VRKLKGEIRSVNQKAIKAFESVMRAYLELQSAGSPPFKDFKMDVERVLKTKRIRELPWVPVPAIVAQEFYGNLFIIRGIYPLHGEGSYFRNYPRSIKTSRSASFIGWAEQATMTDIAPVLLMEPCTEGWLMAHDVTHVDFDGLNLHYEQHRASGASKQGYAYFMYDPDKKQIKIGFSDDPERRLKGLKTGCPDIRLLLKIYTNDMEAAENYYHTLFAEGRREDSEWFFPYKSLVDFLETRDVKI
jgi:hypothetical protein